MPVGDRHRTAAERLRVATWRSDDRVAVLSPRPDTQPPTRSDIRCCIDRLAEQGVQHILTSALGRSEQGDFLASGFEVRSRLHLLAHDLRTLPRSTAGVRLRRGRTTDRPAVLALDGHAFDTFWRLDEKGLDDALDATPVSRFRVATDRSIVGYAVFGRAADRGYVQRLAVEPGHHGRGIGTTLLADGLRWLRRHAVRRAVVNTQEDNETALRLYLGVGFQLEPEGLAVLAYQVGRAR